MVRKSAGQGGTGRPTEFPREGAVDELADSFNGGADSKGVARQGGDRSFNGLAAWASFSDPRLVNCCSNDANSTYAAIAVICLTILSILFGYWYFYNMGDPVSLVKGPAGRAHHTRGDGDFSIQQICGTFTTWVMR